MRCFCVFLSLSVTLLPIATRAVEQAEGDGFVPMFNGKDLSGWAQVNCAPETFYVKDGMIITTGKPTGYIRTERQYENFIAEFEWMHVPPKPNATGNSGFFVWADPIPATGSGGYTRAIEVQVLVNLESKDQYTSHGDIFSIWGARCKPDRPHPNGAERCLPSENRCKGANEWNHYRIEANNGVIKLSVNGKEVSGVSDCRPRKGYLGLEAEGTECRFKKLKIKELPSTNPKPEEIAEVARGLTSMYSGLDMRGWQAGEDHKKHWKPKGWILSYDGGSKADDPPLWTEKEYGDFELIVDWRLPKKGKSSSGIVLRGDKRGEVAIGLFLAGSGTLPGLIDDNTQPDEIRKAGAAKRVADKAPGEWNRFRILMKGDRATIYLNNQLVIDDVRIPGLPQRGRIGLKQREGPVDFAVLFVRELDSD